ncbi:hypothetical protein D3C80_1868310 [compost metagenome]
MPEGATQLGVLLQALRAVDQPRHLATGVETQVAWQLLVEGQGGRGGQGLAQQQVGVGEESCQLVQLGLVEHHEA